LDSRRWLLCAAHMTAVKRHHLAQLHKLRCELYAKLSPQEQRRIDEAKRLLAQRTKQTRLFHL
jgi:hypothetical protein